MRRGVMLLLLVLLFSVGLMAQTADVPPDQVFGVGPSFAVGATPVFAGSGMYAKLLNADSETYSVSTLDVLPNSVKPLTVTTNIGTGIGQKVYEFNVAGQKVKVFADVGAGLSYQGGNTGWSFASGGLAKFKVKGHDLAIAVRWNKSSVSNGTGYQFAPSILYLFNK